MVRLAIDRINSRPTKNGHIVGSDCKNRCQSKDNIERPLFPFNLPSTRNIFLSYFFMHPSICVCSEDLLVEWLSSGYFFCHQSELKTKLTAILNWLNWRPLGGWVAQRWFGPKTTGGGRRTSCHPHFVYLNPGHLCALPTLAFIPPCTLKPPTSQCSRSQPWPLTPTGSAPHLDNQQLQSWSAWPWNESLKLNHSTYHTEYSLSTSIDRDIVL